MRLDETGGTLLGITADLTNHRDRIGVGVVLEHLKQILEIESDHRVTADAHGRGDAETALHKVVHHLIGQCATAGDDTRMTFLEDVGGHDADHRLLRRDQSGTVGADDLHAFDARVVLCLDSIDDRNALGDAHDELDAAVDSLKHGILGEGSRHEDD